MNTPAGQEQPPALSGRKAPRKSRLPLLIIVSLLLVAGGAVAGIFGYKYLYTEPSQEQQTTPVNEVVEQKKETPRLSAKTLVASLRENLSATTLEADYVTIPAIKRDGYSFYTEPYDKSVRYGIKKDVTAEQSNADQIEIDRFFAEKNLSKTVPQDPSLSDFTVSNYVNKDVACQLVREVVSYDGPGLDYRLGCADISEYDTMSKNIQQYAAIIQGEKKR